MDADKHPIAYERFEVHLRADLARVARASVAARSISPSEMVRRGMALVDLFDRHLASGGTVRVAPDPKAPYDGSTSVDVFARRHPSGDHVHRDCTNLWVNIHPLTRTVIDRVAARHGVDDTQVACWAMECLRTMEDAALVAHAVVLVDSARTVRHHVVML